MWTPNPQANFTENHQRKKRVNICGLRVTATRSHSKFAAVRRIHQLPTIIFRVDTVIQKIYPVPSFSALQRHVEQRRMVDLVIQNISTVTAMTIAPCILKRQKLIAVISTEVHYFSHYSS